MKFIRDFRKIYIGMVAGTFLSCSLLGGCSGDEEKWNKVGKEVKEAAEAVTEATVDTSSKAWETAKKESQDLYEKTKDGSESTWAKVKDESSDAWEETKSASQETYEATKEKIHEATAPE